MDNINWHSFGSPNYEYPPFYKKIIFCSLFDNLKIRTGKVIVTGSNRYCIMEDGTGRYFDIDTYLPNWAIDERDDVFENHLTNEK